MSESVDIYIDDDGLRVIDIRGAVPALEAMKALLVSKVALDVSALPRGIQSLDFLRPIADLVTDLRLHAATLRDASAVQDMRNLRSLIVDDDLDLTPVHLAETMPLRHFEGPARRFPGILTLKTLRALSTEMVSEDIAEIVAPLEELSVVLPKSENEVPVLARPLAVREIDIAGPKVLSLTNLRAYPEVRSVGISRVADVRDVAVLQKLPKLEHVVFVDVGKVDSYQVLNALGARLELMRGFKREVEAMRAFPALQIHR